MDQEAVRILSLKLQVTEDKTESVLCIHLRGLLFVMLSI
jgi:hypothetical protein